jgi:hypothetical protein
MKTRLFLKENWYKLTLAASAIIFSIGFFINSLQPAWAAPKESNVKSPQGSERRYAFVASQGYGYLVEWEYDGYPRDKGDIYFRLKKKLP